MFIPEKILINNYDYKLPLNKIADYPLNKRDSSKLLIYNKRNINESIFTNLAEYLEPEDLLVFNNTKVINARILFSKKSGAKIEILCLEPNIPSDFQSAFKQKNKCTWKCIVGNLKKWKNNSLTKEYVFNSIEYFFTVKLLDNKKTFQIIEFAWNSEHNFEEIIKIVGIIPLPPYIKRDAETLDYEKYQTIYSKLPGSVAAPTAGLHFTGEVLKSLESHNISKIELTLHVGAGTFKPVKSENIATHSMHGEHIILTKNTLKILLKFSGHIVAAGTTSLRALESVYWFGVKIITGIEINKKCTIEQWDGFYLQQNIDINQSLEAVINYLEINNIDNLELITEIIIVSGYKFRVVNKLITNFHLPKSTLLLLIAAFIGDDWHKVYDFALNNDFRFLSYGDCSLLIP